MKGLMIFVLCLLSVALPAHSAAVPTCCCSYPDSTVPSCIPDTGQLTCYLRGGFCASSAPTGAPSSAPPTHGPTVSPTTAAGASSIVDPGTFAHTETFLNGECSLFWSVVESTISFGLDCASSDGVELGYVAVSFGDVHNAPVADVVWIYNHSVADYVAGNTSRVPYADDVDNLSDVSLAQISSSRVQALFSRSLDTGDLASDIGIVAGEAIDVSVAFRKGDQTFGRHQRRQRKSLVLVPFDAPLLADNSTEFAHQELYIGGDCSLFWNAPRGGVLDFAIDCTSDSPPIGYIGVAFGDIHSVATPVVLVYDRTVKNYISDRYTPTLDTVQTLANIAFAQLSFSRIQARFSVSFLDPVVTGAAIDVSVAYRQGDQQLRRHTGRERKSVILVAPETTGVPATTAPPTPLLPTSVHIVNPALFENSEQYLDGACSLFWSVSGSAVSFGMDCASPDDGAELGYVALSFGDIHNAPVTDVVWVYNHTVADYVADNASRVPYADDVDNLTGVSLAQISSSRIQVLFSRSIDTGDSAHDVKFVAGELIDVSVAFRTGDQELRRHSRRERRSLLLVPLPVGAPTKAPTSTAPTPAPSQGPLFNATDYVSHIDVIPGQLVMHWTLHDSEVDLALSVMGRGYVSIGISNQARGGMFGADVATGFIAAGVGVVEDLWSSGNTQPVVDAVGDLRSAAVYRSDGWTTLAYTRDIDTGDSEEDRPFLVDAPVELIAAWHESSDDPAVYHGPGNTATWMVDLRLGTVVVEPPDQLRGAHSLLMFFAWGVFAILGALTPWTIRNRLRQGNKWWIPVHALALLLTMLLTLSAIIVIVVYVERQTPGNHFRLETPSQGAHAVMGWILIALSVIDFLLGILGAKLYMWEWQQTNDHHGPPPKEQFFPLGVHRWLSRVLILLSIAVMYTGIVDLQLHVQGLIWGLSLYLFTVCIVVVVAGVYSYKKLVMLKRPRSDTEMQFVQTSTTLN